MSMVEQLKELLKTEKGKKDLNEYFNKIKLKIEIKEFQLKRFYDKIQNGEVNFDNIVEKIINKYDSDDYYEKWIKIGYEPPKPLFYFLFDFAVKYGDKYEDEESKSNYFDVGTYSYGNYIFTLMIGQGSAIIVRKIN